MTLHEDASPELRALFVQGASRLNSAFGRLSSLVSYANSKYSLVQVAESGLYNRGDVSTDLRHFMEPEVHLEELENTRNGLPIWSNLQEKLPYNRMLAGKTNPNVPLAVSINSLPYQRHQWNAKEEVKSEGEAKTENKVAKKPLKIVRPTHVNANYVATVGSDGSVNVWNTELALFRVAHSNFAADFQAPNGDALKGAEAPSKEESRTDDIPYIFKIFDDALDESKAITKKPEPMEAGITPDQNMIDQLYNMGFSVEMAKKALMVTKNVSLSAALD